MTALGYHLVSPLAGAAVAGLLVMLVARFVLRSSCLRTRRESAEGRPEPDTAGG